MTARQKTRNRHITQNQAMDAHTSAYPLLSADLLKAFQMLADFLSVPEKQELCRQLDGGNAVHKKNVLTHWYDMVEARQQLLDLDARVREGRNNWRPQPLAERLDAIANARKLGLRVVTEAWTADVLEVSII